MPNSNQATCLGLEKIWKRTRGEGVRVAVLDTGVWTSSALPADRVVCVSAERDQVAASSDPHGTYCAALIASSLPRAEGAAPAARVLSIQITTDAQAITARQVARGLRHALDLGCDVISCSFTLSSFGKSEAEITAAIREAHLRGIPVLAAHGNTHGEAAPFPETVPHATVVSAHGTRGQALPVNHNSWTDIFALGERLTVVDGNGAKRIWPGQTSGATALTAGVVALALAAVSKGARQKVGMAMDGLIKASGTAMAGAVAGSALRLDAQRLVDAAISLGP